MNTVKDALAQKSGALIHVGSAHGRRSLAPDARQPGPVGAGHRRRRTGRYRDPG